MKKNKELVVSRNKLLSTFKDLITKINKGADVNHQNQDGDTPLMFAALFGYKDIVALLLNKGADVNHQNQDGNTALIWAAENGHKDIVEFLISKGADINHKNQNNNTPLMIAASHGHKEVAQLLINNGAYFNLANQEGFTALMLAVINGHLDIVEIFIKELQGVGLVKSTNTTLMLAAKNGFTHTVEKLITVGADINLVNQEVFTALILAALNGHKEIVAMLLNTTINFVNHDFFNSVLFITVAKGYKDIVEKLVTVFGAKNLTNQNSTTALMIAAENGHKEVVVLLLKAGADVNYQNQYGTTALMLAAKNGYKYTVKSLITAGADVNLVNEDGSTALMYAADKGHTYIVKSLITAGANVNVENKFRTTALMLAVKNDYLDVVEIIIFLGNIANLEVYNFLRSIFPNLNPEVKEKFEQVINIRKLFEKTKKLYFWYIKNILENENGSLLVPAMKKTLDTVKKEIFNMPKIKALNVTTLFYLEKEFFDSLNSEFKDNLKYQQIYEEIFTAGFLNSKKTTELDETQAALNETQAVLTAIKAKYEQNINKIKNQFSYKLKKFFTCGIWTSKKIKIEKIKYDKEEVRLNNLKNLLINEISQLKEEITKINEPLLNNQNVSNINEEKNVPVVNQINNQPRCGLFG